MLRDPLIHFLAAGAVLFAVAAWRSDDAPPERIVITAERVAQVASSAAVLSGREPTTAELEALLEPVVREEVFYREALALGLDENDDEVRRRLVEKMRYLSENLADPEPPSSAAIQAFYDADPARFEIPEMATFDQVFFSPEQRGAALDADVSAGLAALRDGAAPESVGDRTPLESRLSNAPRERVQVLFGTALTDAVFAGETDRWLGPYRSDFGLHLVRVIARTPARIPPFAEIEPQVAAVYAADSRARANEAAYQEILSRYDVVVELPRAEPAGGAE